MYIHGGQWWVVSPRKSGKRKPSFIDVLSFGGLSIIIAILFGERGTSSTIIILMI